MSEAEEVEGNDFTPESNPSLFYGIITLGVFMGFISFSVCMLYIRTQKRAYARQKEIQERLMADVDTSAWLNAAAFNGNQPVTETFFVETDLEIESFEQFQSLLELYYGHHAPSMTQEDILIVAQNHFETGPRNQLELMFKDEYGESLADFLQRVQQQTLRRNRNTQRRAPAAADPVEDANFPGFGEFEAVEEEQPSVRIAGEKPIVTTSEGLELSLRTDLYDALKRRGLDRYYDPLKELGVTTLSAMRNMTDIELVPIVVSEEDLERLMEIATNAQLLYVAEMDDPADII